MKNKNCKNKIIFNKIKIKTKKSKQKKKMEYLIVSALYYDKIHTLTILINKTHIIHIQWGKNNLRENLSTTFYQFSQVKLKKEEE